MRFFLLSNGSAIEWTESTWNPSTGCTQISPGCKNCYAERLTKRLKAMGQKKYRQGFQYKEHHSEINLPLKWKKPRKIFVNSMSDMFHENATMEFIGACFATMIKANWHTYQVLTKRPSKMADFSKFFKDYFGYRIPPHIWMGTSIENEDYKWRITELRKVNCHTRFLSIEPLLGSMGELNLQKIDWVIIGGESGPHHRPVRKEWILDIIHQCEKQKVAVFFKQWGGFTPKAGGRKINHRTYDQYPEIKQIKISGEISFNRKSFQKIICVNEPLVKPIVIKKIQTTYK